MLTRAGKYHECRHLNCSNHAFSVTAVSLGIVVWSGRSEFIARRLPCQFERDLFCTPCLSVAGYLHSRNTKGVSLFGERAGRDVTQSISDKTRIHVFCYRVHVVSYNHVAAAAHICVCAGC